jgi:hypothetical protein
MSKVKLNEIQQGQTQLSQQNQTPSLALVTKKVNFK